jgi:EpsI family protein
MIRRAIALASLVAASAIVIRAASSVEAVPLRRSLADLPASLGQWRSAGDSPLDRATLDVLRADDYVSRIYVSGRIPAELFVAYYTTQRQGDTMHSPMNCLPAAGWQTRSTGRIEIPVGGGASVTTNRYIIQKGLDERLVLYWYQSHGRMIASEYASKVYLVLDSLRLRRSDAGLVRVIVPMSPGVPQPERAAADFVRALYPALDDFIPR